MRRQSVREDRPICRSRVLPVMVVVQLTLVGSESIVMVHHRLRIVLRSRRPSVLQIRTHPSQMWDISIGMFEAPVRLQRFQWQNDRRHRPPEKPLSPLANRAIGAPCARHCYLPLKSRKRPA